MEKKIAWFMLLVLALSMTVSVPAAATIIWVSEYHDYDNDGIVDDQEWIDLLEAQGYEVNLDFCDGNGTTLDAAEIAALNSADLVIMSRCSSSGEYASNAGEIAQWNSITAPLIQLSAWHIRNTRWIWLDSGTTIGNGGAPILKALVPSNPIFKGVTLDASNHVDVLDETVGSGQTSFIEAADAGNGTVLARPVGNDDWVWIAEWDEGVEFYTGAGQIAGGPRILFCAGANEAAGAGRGAYNLTTQGEIIFLNIVQKFLGGNRRPIVDAGDYQSFLWPGSSLVVQLDATVSDDGKPYQDPPADPCTPVGLTLTWSKVKGPGSVTFSPGNDIEDPTATFSAAGMYELRLRGYDGEKDACDVVAIYIRSNDDPIAHWDFDEGSGTTVNDDSANNNEGDLAGDPEPNWVDGCVGSGAMEFFGVAATTVNSYVNITTDDTIDPNLDSLRGEISLSAWIKTTEVGNTIVADGDNTWRMGIRRSEPAGRLFFVCNGPSGGDLDSVGLVNDDRWHHVVAVYDGATASLYIDGVLDNSSERAGLIDINDLPITIGARYDDATTVSHSFNGLIDDVRVYSYSLSAAQIEALAAMGSLVPVVDAGQDQTFSMQDGFVQLDGTVTDDGKPVAATLEWSKISGPGDVVFSDTAIEDPTATFSEVGTYVLRLTADDTTAAVYDEVTITVENPTCQDVIDDGLLFVADISGPAGSPDCYIDLYDFAMFAGDWLRCNDPQDPDCELVY